ncbi:MAG: argininosuccinate synthase [Bacteroidia bacterium]|jgi:argininosuccinate synthase|nr:argininosuccinate synthase [Bacteroidia bacterium]MCC6768299.1 argininosuccinate synthase [Bacteroidia bacterium]
MKTILAFSGGLDTTYCAIYLHKQLGHEVHAVTVNTGGFSEEEISDIQKHAEQLGVSSYTCIDERKNYYQKIIKYLVFGNVLKNNTYPLSVSAERFVQAMAIAEFAKEHGAHAVAHGSTGAGNDQVRFDMVFNILCPDLKVITPIRDQQLSREAEIEYLQQNGVKMNFEKAAYSINKGLWGTSIGGRETLNSRQALPEEAWPTQLGKHTTEQISLTFQKGELIGINEQQFAHPVDAIIALEVLAAPYAIGRDIHVGDTIIGIKGRVGFEAAAPLMIIKAHHLLEKHVLTKWQLYWKDQIADFYGNWLHEGQFLDPVMRNLETMMQSMQEHVSGKVYIELHPYRFTMSGIESSYDLMSPKFGSYGEMNRSWSGEDVKGFAKIFGNQVAIYEQVRSETQKKQL